MTLLDIYRTVNPGIHIDTHQNANPECPVRAIINAMLDPIVAPPPSPGSARYLLASASEVLTRLPIDAIGGFAEQVAVDAAQVAPPCLPT